MIGTTGLAAARVGEGGGEESTNQSNRAWGLSGDAVGI